MRTHSPPSRSHDHDDASQGSAVTALISLVSATWSSDEKVLANAAAALSILTRDEHSRAPVVLAGAVKPLVEVLIQSAAMEDRTLGYATAALRNMARDSDSRPQIVRQGAIRPLVALCRGGGDSAVRGNAAEALVNLALHDGSRRTLLNEGAVGPLVQLCCVSKEAGVLIAAATALSRMCAFEGTKLAPLAGPQGLQGLKRVQTVLGQGIPSYLRQSLSDAIVTLTPRLWERNIIRRTFLGVQGCRPGAAMNMNRGVPNDWDLVGGFFTNFFSQVMEDEHAAFQATLRKDFVLEQLSAFFDGPEADTYLLFWSGRGKRDTGDWWLANMQSISYHELVKVWRDSAAVARNSYSILILIMDSCFSGGWVSKAAEAQDQDIVIQASCSKTQTSKDGVFTQSWLDLQTGKKTRAQCLQDLATKGMEPLVYTPWDGEMSISCASQSFRMTLIHA